MKGFTHQQIPILFTFAAMVSKSFDINTTGLQPFEPSEKRLIVEVSPESVSVILLNKLEGIPEGVEIFNGTHDETEDWEAMVQQSRLMGLADLETLVVIAYPHMLPIPASLYTPESAKAQMELFFGFKQGCYASGDVLEEHDMVIAWQIPQKVQDFLSGHFQLLQVKHLVTLLMANSKITSPAEGRVVLYGNLGWIVLWLDGKVQIAKSVAFVKPDDLSWHLLNLCRQFNLEPTAVNWKVSGMAEASSPLWHAITRFLDPVEAMDAGVAVQEELPGHYFAHLFSPV